MSKDPEDYFERYAEIIDDAWVKVARDMVLGPYTPGGHEPLEPRLLEKLRLKLQAEYRYATGEEHAVLIVEHNPPQPAAIRAKGE